MMINANIVKKQKKRPSELLTSEGFCFYKSLLLLFAFLIASKSFSQNYLNYYETINKAEIASLDKKYQKSDSLYQTAFSFVKRPFKEDFLMAAINSEKLGNNQKTSNYLKNGIRNGLILKKIKKNFCQFKKSVEWKFLQKEYKTERLKYLKTLNLPLAIEIEGLIRNDQKARKPIFGSWKKMKKTDSYNYNRLMKIIKENGNKWPGFSIIGETIQKGKYDVSGNIVLLLLHFKKEWVKELQPYMLQAVMDGEMYPYHYARIIDYKEILNCQKFGTYLFNEKHGGTEICDCEEAEEKRKNIGFESIKDYYRKRNSSYKCKE